MAYLTDAQIATQLAKWAEEIAAASRNGAEIEMAVDRSSAAGPMFTARILPARREAKA